MRRRGATKQAIVDTLTRLGPLTAAQIADHAGLPAHVVRVSIGAMLTRFGGVVRVGKDGASMVYGIPGRDNVRHTARHREHVAGPRYVAPMRELRRDPFEHMRLALLGRGAA